MRLLASENALDMTLYTPEGTVFFSAGTKNGLLSAGKEGSSLLGVQGESTFPQRRKYHCCTLRFAVSAR